VFIVFAFFSFLLAALVNSQEWHCRLQRFDGALEVLVVVTPAVWALVAGALLLHATELRACGFWVVFVFC
jgi:hypothetical protein